MSIETSIYAALGGLVENRVFRDVAPQTITALPRITFQAVGGKAINYLGPESPGKNFCRVQVNVWHNRRDEANTLARQVADTLRAYTQLQVTVLGEFVATYEEDTKLYGTRQDFEVFG